MLKASSFSWKSYFFDFSFRIRGSFGLSPSQIENSHSLKQMVSNVSASEIRISGSSFSRMKFQNRAFWCRYSLQIQSKHFVAHKFRNTKRLVCSSSTKVAGRNPSSFRNIKIKIHEVRFGCPSKNHQKLFFVKTVLKVNAKRNIFRKWKFQHGFLFWSASPS